MDGSPATNATGERPTVRLYRAALGPVHAEHYLPAFTRFDERGRAGPTWNLWAFVFHLGWLIYRQLWGAAGELAALLAAWGLVAAGLWSLADGWPVGVRVGLALALLLLLLLVPGLFGTALLHAQVRQRMLKAVEASPTVEAACAALQAQGAALRQRSAWGVAALLLGAGAMGLALWTWHVAGTQSPAPSREATEAAVRPGAPTTAPVPTTATEANTETAKEPPAQPAVADPPPALPVAATDATAPARNASSLAPTPATPDQPLPPAVTAGASAPGASATSTAADTSAPKDTPVGTEVRTRARGFGVSVGLFAVADNAQRVAATLSGAGLPVMADPIESARGPMTRVRVGPFPNRDEAEAAAVRVRGLGLEARVYAP
jgi:cell division septation protein DedD